VEEQPEGLGDRGKAGIGVGVWFRSVYYLNNNNNNIYYYENNYVSLFWKTVRFILKSD